MTRLAAAVIILVFILYMLFKPYRESERSPIKPEEEIMLTWICDNIATIVICAVLIAVVAAIIAGMVRNRKKGKSGCSCGCSGCPMGGCHKSDKQS